MLQFDIFGWSTGYAGGSAIVEAPYLGDAPTRAGAAYVYALRPSMARAALQMRIV
ncbi:hypothetical protein WMF38_06475 [Sorangium sp. So ce118]